MTPKLDPISLVAWFSSFRALPRPTSIVLAAHGEAGVAVVKFRPAPGQLPVGTDSTNSRPRTFRALNSVEPALFGAPTIEARQLLFDSSRSTMLMVFWLGAAPARDQVFRVPSLRLKTLHAFGCSLRPSYLEVDPPRPTGARSLGSRKPSPSNLAAVLEENFPRQNCHRVRADLINLLSGSLHRMVCSPEGVLRLSFVGHTLKRVVRHLPLIVSVLSRHGFGVTADSKRHLAVWRYKDPRTLRYVPHTVLTVAAPGLSPETMGSREVRCRWQIDAKLWQREVNDFDLRREREELLRRGRQLARKLAAR
jgi:hypothetical protein